MGKPLDIIITDHHQCQEGQIPQAYAILNPHMPDCPYPFKYLCGAGIALKLVQAVGIMMGKPEVFKEYLIWRLGHHCRYCGSNGENRDCKSWS